MAVSKGKESLFSEPLAADADPARGLCIARVFSAPGQHPFDGLEWERRDAVIRNHKGAAIFEQLGVEFPSSWSPLAVNVVASKYFYGDLAKGNGSPAEGRREHSLKQLVHRVTRTIADWGLAQGYFATPADAEAFYDELTWLCVNQYGAFNSPVWFNVGLHHLYGVRDSGGKTISGWDATAGPDGGQVADVDPYERPQASACQPYRALVSTPEGMVPIGELVEERGIGREVYDAHGTTHVVAVQANGRKEVFRVVLRNGQFVEATADHLVCAVEERRTGRAWRRVDELRPGMRMHLFPHRAKVAAAAYAGFDDEPDEAQPQAVSEAALAGWLQADGFVGQYPAGTSRSLTAEFMTVTDDEHAYVLGHLDTVFPDAHRHVREVLAKDPALRVRRIRLYGEGLRPFVERWGLLARGTAIRAPRHLFTASRAEIGAYLRSLFQADGYVTIRRERGCEQGRIAFAVISEAWTEDVQLLLNLLGIYARRIRKAERRADRHDLHEVVIAVGSERERFAAHVGFVGADKQARLLDGLGLRGLKACPDLREEEIVRVEPLGVEEVYDIQTASGEYLSNNVAVHNCFIIGVDDSIDDIWKLMGESARLFKFGSGVGADWSKLRSSRERLSGGGTPSGPVLFMKVQDATGGTIKSGGKTRRAAIMQTLKCWHPDVVEFVRAKQDEERKAWALIEQGYDGSFNGPAYGSVAFQNVNQTLRVTDGLMQAAEADETYALKAVTTGETLETVQARELLRAVAEGTHVCGDPGLQYEDAIQRWHTCKASGPINSSNPCCFVAETLVETSEGRIAIGELAARAERGRALPLAFTFDLGAGHLALRPLTHAWKAGDTQRLVEVTTDKGLAFTCTPEHRFLLRDGRYDEARHLQPGMRLRKLARGRNEHRSDRRMIYGADGSGEYQARWLWEQANGPVPDRHHVHHINGDPTDDRLSNLAVVPAEEHFAQHAAGAANPRFLDTDDALLVRVYDHVLAAPKRTHKDGPTLTVARWNRAVDALGLAGQVPKARGDGRIQAGSWAAFCERLVALGGEVNDTVQAVRAFASEPTPVFDVEVEGTRNFFVASGEALHAVCVHNSEYMFLDNSACNLASLNLRKFQRPDGSFDVARYRAAARIYLTAQEILVDNAGYPSHTIARNSHDYRPLGLGFANLGALLMAMGLPYDSDEGRAVAGALMAILHCEGYARSAEMAANPRVGPFPGYEKNREPMLAVMRMHRDAVQQIHPSCPGYLRDAAQESANQMVALGEAYGYRNAQATVLAPTGTIGFMMDCDTTGVEPDIALVKYKLLAGKGDGLMKLVNTTVPEALAHLGYTDAEAGAILAFVDQHDTIEGAPGLAPEHLPVFDCAFKPERGERSIHHSGHIRMMAAVQPFISGAISKTVNLPEDAAVEDIYAAYVEGWTLGLKAVAIYRENSKRSQPLSTRRDHGAEKGAPAEAVSGDGALTAEPQIVERVVEKVVETVVYRPVRKRLPDERPSITHKFSIAGHEGYLHVGQYPDSGMPGEIFITMAKQGSTIAGVMDAFATSISIALQYGVPLEDLVAKFSHTRFEPAGFTNNRQIPMAKSIMDYIFRYLSLKYLGREQADPVAEAEAAVNPKVAVAAEADRHGPAEDQAQADLFVAAPGVAVEAALAAPAYAETDAPSAFGNPPSAFRNQEDAPACPNCGSITVRAGACYSCVTCGTSTGCG